MALKNHYQTLRLPSNASQEEIKKAFRKLAHQFHPDKNDHTSSHVIFQEIQAAYAVLSDEKKKKQYDEERYFSGLSTRKQPGVISAEWILKLARELQKHMIHVHSQDLNHHALYQYVMLILSDAHLAYLQQEHDEQKNERIVDAVLQAVRKIDFELYLKIFKQITFIDPLSVTYREKLQGELQAKKKQFESGKRLPWLVFTIVVIICLIMYLYGKR
ncbi:MAG TPA: DnaJ domain-containing protein [Flavipsychrobacter sp.]|nr:DnaJ domain-containing protein [Flavipsychrobacter sp.]